MPPCWRALNAESSPARKRSNAAGVGSVLALAVRWILDRGPTIALWGARRPEQLAAIDTAMGWSLDEAAMHEIDRILDRTITIHVGPEFMAPPAAPADRAAA